MPTSNIECHGHLIADSVTDLKGTLICAFHVNKTVRLSDHDLVINIYPGTGCVRTTRAVVDDNGRERDATQPYVYWSERNPDQPGMSTDLRAQIQSLIVIGLKMVKEGETSTDPRKAAWLKFNAGIQVRASSDNALTSGKKLDSAKSAYTTDDSPDTSL